MEHDHCLSLIVTNKALYFPIFWIEPKYSSSICKYGFQRNGRKGQQLGEFEQLNTLGFIYPIIWRKWHQTWMLKLSKKLNIICFWKIKKDVWYRSIHWQNKNWDHPWPIFHCAFGGRNNLSHMRKLMRFDWFDLTSDR